MKRKNKKIIFGSLLAVLLLMMLPAIPAIEVNTVKETNKTSFLGQLAKSYDINKLKERIENSDEFQHYLVFPLLKLAILYILLWIYELKHLELDRSNADIP